METNCLTVKQVAEKLHVSLATVYQLCAERKLGHVRLGPKCGTIRISEQALQAFLESCKIQPDRPKRREVSS